MIPSDEEMIQFERNRVLSELVQQIVAQIRIHDPSEHEVRWIAEALKSELVPRVETIVDRAKQSMQWHSTMNRRNLITIPAAIRRAMDLRPGQQIEFDVVGDLVIAKKANPDQGPRRGAGEHQEDQE
ncbi:AbrB/MazE/SpoVT family DNA-binding domain-containing protein [Roseateles asaccharophilus]|uniref:AbrB family looped-hinge helix DNA binding protein n=1 Tax=Roseateles asaccharophilus TaxID=582607 RepID=A0ABU2AAY5_9BURK|nr:AbrB/MazE/SpoVT family DNA-binding domain-containing protein [Roseateles asaccharophilus]MDR7334285.1 AbrB family looped-hinge helix DNA binding protein [Roseateles asaccharophilus]